MQEWENFASWHIKTEMKRRNLTLSKLTQLFRANGHEVSLDSLRGKIARGKFSFIFYLQFMQVLGVNEFKIDFEQNPEKNSIKLS